jgi:hypothetical protein
MLLSRKLLIRILGALWLIDGLLQLQPKMFTMDMVNGIMVPTMHSQPYLIATSLQWLITMTTLHLTLVNLVIAIVQICLGIGLLLFSERWVKGLVIASVIWALIVWFGGEGFSMLLAAQGSIITGAPGAVLLYLLLGLVVYPRPHPQSYITSKGAEAKVAEGELLSRVQLRGVLAGFWLFAALLQLQPYWWQEDQISRVIGAMTGQGGLNGVLVDPILQAFSNITASVEIPLNIALILVFLALGLVLALLKEEQMRPALIASIVASLVIWYCSEGLGQIFTGMSTDFNSGLLLVVIGLACWPKGHFLRVACARFARETRLAKGVSLTRPA